MQESGLSPAGPGRGETAQAVASTKDLSPVTVIVSSPVGVAVRGVIRRRRRMSAALESWTDLPEGTPLRAGTGALPCRAIFRAMLQSDQLMSPAT